MEKKEIEFVDFLQVVWKRKILLILGTILCMVVAGAISFLIKPVYEIDSIIQPGKFYIETQQGNLTQVIVETPQQIADKVNHASYNALIAQKLKLDEKDIPKIESKFIKDTLLTRIWIKDPNIQLSKDVLNSLILLLKEDMDKKIHVEINNIDTSINSNKRQIVADQISIESKKIEQGRISKEINNLKNKLKIIEKRKGEIQIEMKEVKMRIGNLEKEQMATLKKENKSEAETLSLLLYSNEVQETLRYYNNLQEGFANKELSEEDINIQIEGKKENIKQLDNQIKTIKNKIENIKNHIANLKERKGRIDYTKIVKEPTSSIDPVSPKKKLNVLIAGIVSFLLLISLIFIFEYLKRHKIFK